MNKNTECSNFFNIFDWMTDILKLKAVDKLIYAQIYSYTIYGGSFYGSIDKLAEVSGATPQTVISHLQQLVDKQLLIKRPYKKVGFINKFEYIANLDYLKTLNCPVSAYKIKKSK